MQDFALAEPQLPLAVVCHDAGGANQVVSWLESVSLPQCRGLMRGPAAAIAARSRATIRPCTDLDEVLHGARTVVTGTGWASDLEHLARRKARTLGVRSIAMLDHWVNYRERFVRDGETVLPDEVWVTDSYALAEARRVFPDIPVSLRPNLYLGKLVREAGTPGSDALVLYALEPMRSHWGREIAGEFQALDYFVANMHRLDLPTGARVRLRLHPQEAPGKYDRWLEAQRHVADLDLATDLPAAMADAGWVAGCETAALVLALATGRRAVCTLPPWAPVCRLPHDGLIHLKLLAQQRP